MEPGIPATVAAIVTQIQIRLDRQRFQSYY